MATNKNTPPKKKKEAPSKRSDVERDVDPVEPIPKPVKRKHIVEDPDVKEEDVITDTPDEKHPNAPLTGTPDNVTNAGESLKITNSENLH